MDITCKRGGRFPFLMPVIYKCLDKMLILKPLRRNPYYVRQCHQQLLLLQRCVRKICLSHCKGMYAISCLTALTLLLLTLLLLLLLLLLLPPLLFCSNCIVMAAAVAGGGSRSSGNIWVGINIIDIFQNSTSCPQVSFISLCEFRSKQRSFSCMSSAYCFL